MDIQLKVVGTYFKQHCKTNNISNRLVDFDIDQLYTVLAGQGYYPQIYNLIIS